jgi:hypothetical protein
MDVTVSVGHLRPDHEDCECAEELDHVLFDCDCLGYPLAADDNARP